MQVVAAVIFDGPRVLLARRGPGRRHEGLWEFPGGKVEVGETPEAALSREIAEELSVRIRVDSLLTVVQDETIVLSAYRAEIVEGSPELREHDQVRWMLPTEIALLPMPELDQEVRLSL